MGLQKAILAKQKQSKGKKAGKMKSAVVKDKTYMK